MTSAADLPLLARMILSMSNEGSRRRRVNRSNSTSTRSHGKPRQHTTAKSASGTKRKAPVRSNVRVAGPKRSTAERMRERSSKPKPKTRTAARAGVKRAAAAQRTRKSDDRPRARSDERPRTARPAVSTPDLAETARPELTRSNTTAAASVKGEPEMSALAEKAAALKKTFAERVFIHNLFSKASLKPETKPKAKADSPLYANARREKLISSVTCLTCLDDIPARKTAKLSCGHIMCKECLLRIFKLSIQDPAHMPPRCCTSEHIPLKHVEKFFSNNFKIEWNQKYQEFTAKNRLYCPTRKCGTFIKPSTVTTDAAGRKSAKCPKCKIKICGKCNQKWHSSVTCPQDEETIRFASMAEQSGWKKCYKCSAMVELREGCNHMTCRCTAEFCMVCGKKWKTCDCPWFNYTQENQPPGLQPPQEVLNRAGGFRGRLRRSPLFNPNGNGPQNAAPNNAYPEIRYQEELDRRREQEQTDEVLARRIAEMENHVNNHMAGLNIRGGGERERARLQRNVQQPQDLPPPPPQHQQAQRDERPPSYHRELPRGHVAGHVPGRHAEPLNVYRFHAPQPQEDFVAAPPSSDGYVVDDYNPAVPLSRRRSTAGSRRRSSREASMHGSSSGGRWSSGYYGVVEE